MIKIAFLLLALFCFKAYSLGTNNNKTIYGTDDRLDYYEIDESRFKEMSSSVAAMIDKGSLIQKDGYFKVIGTNLRNESNCPNIKFKDQISVAKCSGFLIDSETLVTTSTCIKTAKDCEKFVWAFGFKRNFKRHRVSSFSNDQVYGCTEILKRVHSPKQSLSYAIIRLNKSNNTATPLNLNMDGNIASNQKILMLGHPQGLPLKASVQAKTSKIYKNSFRANVDSAFTSAGSPVFDSKTLTVQGMYLKGPRAQRTRTGCNRPLNQSIKKSFEVIMHTKHITK
jgi:V8-like Glu-specific endopeptidase